MFRSALPAMGEPTRNGTNLSSCLVLIERLTFALKIFVLPSFSTDSIFVTKFIAFYALAASTALVVCRLLSLDALSPVLIALAAVMIAALGVPHGGLDHWCGRRLLQPRLGRAWAIAFFPAYLGVAVVVAWAWITWPVATIAGFFLLSAWHFGREEGHTRSLVAAVSVGGLVIWANAIFRPDEMNQILSAIIPGSESNASAASITNATAWGSMLFIPLAAVCLVRAVRKTQLPSERLAFVVVPLATVVLAATTPILVSFTLYFCLWHSVLGLCRLRRMEGLGLRSFFVAITPLSVLAVLLVVAFGTVGLATPDSVLSVTTLQSSAALQMTFIGLASIAIPHIFLHEFGPALLVRQTHARFTSAERALALEPNA